MNKEKLIPDLRFPEFVNEGEWKKKAFEDLFEIGNGRDYKHLEKGEIPVYGSGGYMLSVNDYLYDGQSVCIGRKGTIDKPMFLSGKFWTVDTLFYTHSFKDCTPKFVYYIFQNINWLNHNEAGGVPSLSKTNIYKIETIVPKPKEQQKISSCFSSLDEVIAAHSKKLELLKDHKKGLMQNLFPQEGEKVPKFRFKEFRNDGEWGEIAINKLVPQNEKYGIVDGPFGSNLKTIHYKTEGIPIITSGYVTEGIFKADKYLYVTEEKFNDEKRSSVKGGDIVMAKIGARCGASAIMPRNHRIGILSGNALKITIDQSKHSTNFVWQQLWYLHSNDKFSGIKSIGAQPAISMDSLKKFELIIPPRIQEQQKIASCLSSLDALIVAKTEKIEQLNLHKKGLMQSLFPKIIE